MMSGNLYLVATPIGNLGDLTHRAEEILTQVDFIAAEDTRVTIKLLNHLKLKKPMVSYYRHNFEKAGLQIVSRILAGESCALVSDAGTPAISDPGEELVTLCHAHQIPVYSVPGPCALISALTVSGLPTGRFTFEGFLAMNQKNRREHLKSLKGESRTMLFYEAPHKLRSTLEDLCDTFGPDREIAICRELTKLHEQVLRTTLGKAVVYFSETAPRGEFVLVVSGKKEKTEPSVSIEEAVRLALEYHGAGLSFKEAVRKTAEETGLPKNELYAAALKERRM